MTPSDYQGFVRLAQRLAGISLRSGSEALVSARVAARVRALALADEHDYLDLLQGEHGHDETVHFLDAISTGFTSFWRERLHFDDVRERVLLAYGAGQRRFRFWSAACSTGEEAWSLAMTLDVAFANLDVDWKILATDLSIERLEHALAGRYTEAEVSALEPVTRDAYFTRVAGEGAGTARGKATPETRVGDPGTYAVNAALRERVTFRRLNLAQVPYPMRGPLDAIFCRNVMFYFDLPARRGFVTEAERLLRPGGTLYIGTAETLGGCNTRLVLHRPSIFRSATPEARR